ncbi:hypothetical protein, partial [Salmonella enterica]|uniref:hypothetical protein n=1 Tax=Salmonella enterica TaxID=28901 RepID=UPI0020C5AF0F
CLKTKVGINFKNFDDPPKKRTKKILTHHVGVENKPKTPPPTPTDQDKNPVPLPYKTGVRKKKPAPPQF